MTALRPEVSAAAPIAADQHALSPSTGGLLINIDNGGTLTDFCVIDGANVYRTKSVTTPYDVAE
jgi:N-methylhydantoinase A